MARTASMITWTQMIVMTKEEDEERCTAITLSATAAAAVEIAETEAVVMIVDAVTDERCLNL